MRIVQLAVICALCSVVPKASPDPLRTYRLEATSASQTSIRVPSCGASERMLRDVHTLVVADDSVSINGLPWKTIHSSNEGVLLLSFHDGHGQLTYLTMELQIDDRSVNGIYTLYGVSNRTPKGWSPCLDRVEVQGTRL